MHATTETPVQPAGAPRYPEEFETDVVLRDGSTVHIRPLCPGDAPGLESFFAGLSLDSRVFRFFSAGMSPRSAARLAAEVDYQQRFGLVATAHADHAIVGHAMYVEIEAETVDVAFVLSDEMQGRGLGTVLLAHIAEAARSRGHRAMLAEIMPNNERMLEMLRESGYPFKFSSTPGAVRAFTPLALSPEGIERFEERDHVAGAAAVSHLMRPASVALVGASRDRARVGGAVLHNLIEAGFSGTIYPVNPHAHAVQGVRAYESVCALPEVPELAVVAVPAAGVPAVMEDCVRAGVPAAVVISAGFAEVGAAGRALQDQIVETCRSSGMRLLGPNCLGVLNTAAGTRLNATFARRMPPAGPLALASQSGALGLAAIEQAAARGLGLAGFASVGNKADISGNDLLHYWEEDSNVGVIALYLESFGNPRKFARVARRVARTKPIVAVKSGRTPAGVRAAASHTGAMLAASDMTVDALFRQSGVIRADSLGDLLDITALLGTQPAPRGRRVGVVTNSGGPGILATDALAAEGLELARLSDELQQRLRGGLGDGASTRNPVDMLATAGPDEYRDVMRALAEDDGVDTLIAIYTPTGLDDPNDVLRGIAAGIDAVEGRIPVQVVALTPESPGGILEGERHAAPIYPFPEDAARALAHAVRRAAWLERPPGELVEFADVRPHEAAAAIATGIADDSEWMPLRELEQLLRAYGLPLVEGRSVTTPAAAAAAARELDGAVALKGSGPGLVHKSDVGAVRIGLEGPEEVERAATEMQERVQSRGLRLTEFLVQRMAPPGVETLVGVVHDPLFGPVVACGAGGTSAEVLGDASARITPLTDRDARELIRSMRILPLLTGWRGAPPCDIAALEDTLLRVSAMVEAHPEIVELDLNPLIVGPEGVVIVDARVRVQPASAPRPWPAIDSAEPARPRGD